MIKKVAIVCVMLTLQHVVCPASNDKSSLCIPDFDFSKHVAFKRRCIPINLQSGNDTFFTALYKTRLKLGVEPLSGMADERHVVENEYCCDIVVQNLDPETCAAMCASLCPKECGKTGVRLAVRAIDTNELLATYIDLVGDVVLDEAAFAACPKPIISIATACETFLNGFRTRSINTQEGGEIITLKDNVRLLVPNDPSQCHLITRLKEYISDNDVQQMLAEGAYLDLAAAVATKRFLPESAPVKAVMLIEE